MTPIEKFAKEQLGITLFDAQIDTIRAVADGKVKVFSRLSGRATARKVMQEYLKASLGDKYIKGTGFYTPMDLPPVEKL